LSSRCQPRAATLTPPSQPRSFRRSCVVARGCRSGARPRPSSGVLAATTGSSSARLHSCAKHSPPTLVELSTSRALHHVHDARNPTTPAFDPCSKRTGGRPCGAASRGPPGRSAPAWPNGASVAHRLLEGRPASHLDHDVDLWMPGAGLHPYSRMRAVVMASCHDAGVWLVDDGVAPSRRDELCALGRSDNCRTDTHARRLQVLWRAWTRPAVCPAMPRRARGPDDRFRPDARAARTPRGSTPSSPGARRQAALPLR